MDSNKQNMVGTFAVSNEMLYDLMRDLKSDMNRRFDDVDRRFDEVYKKFADVDGRFIEVNKKIDRLEESNRHEHEAMNVKIDRLEESNRHEHEVMNNKIDGVYVSRDRVTVNFTRTWVFASFIIAILSSVFSLALLKAV